MIYPEEMTHCAAGVKWFTYLCLRSRAPYSCGDSLASQASKDPKSESSTDENDQVIQKFHDTVRTYFRGPLKPPFNEAARKAAGFGPEWYEPLAFKDVTGK